MADDGEPGTPTTDGTPSATTTPCSSPTRRADSSKMFSAEMVNGLEGNHRDRLALPPSYPLPLMGFVCFLAIVSGFAVVGVHYAVTYAGCPLGLNGCNEFLGKEDRGYILIRWVDRTFNSKVPEDVVYIVCAVLGAVAYVTLLRCLPENLAFQVRGGGTVQSLVAVTVGERITLTAAALRVLVTSIYLGSCGTLGMDGPAIQMCTAIITCLGYLIGMRAVQTQSLLACLGFAGGFAASFNSPLAGILFAMEELQHISSSVSSHIICLIIMTSVVSTSVRRLCTGENSLFDAAWDKDGGLHKVFGPSMWMLVAVPIAVVCSLCGFLASKGINWSWTCVFRARKKMSTKFIFVVMLMLSAVVGAVVFRITGLRGVWGIGYESMQKAFDQNIDTSHFFVFAGGKMLATVLSVVVSAPGDILEPILISGGFLGGGIGYIVKMIIQDDGLANQVVKPCIAFGMVSLFASCFRFPLTPVLIVLEFMGEETYAIVLPTALASFTAIIVSNKLFPPFLDQIMYHEGINLEELRQEVEAECLEAEIAAYAEAEAIQRQISEDPDYSSNSESIKSEQGVLEDRQTTSQTQDGKELQFPPTGLLETRQVSGGTQSSNQQSIVSGASSRSSTGRLHYRGPQRQISGGSKEKLGIFGANLESSMMSLSAPARPSQAFRPDKRVSMNSQQSDRHARQISPGAFWRQESPPQPVLPPVEVNGQSGGSGRHRRTSKREGSKEMPAQTTAPAMDDVLTSNENTGGDTASAPNQVTI